MYKVPTNTIVRIHYKWEETNFIAIRNSAKNENDKDRNSAKNDKDRSLARKHDSFTFFHLAEANEDNAWNWVTAS